MTSTEARLSSALSDRYRLERELGQGGMATVYLAEDLKHGRKVAIKVLHPELSAVIGGDRFLAEIKVTASLQHPHILGLIDSGAVPLNPELSTPNPSDDSRLPTAGLLYYVMPFVAGESLRARLTREKQLPVDDAIRLAKEVANALDYAHRHGVVHRDIKPENILLQEGAALVADFGIALAVQQAGGSRMTQTGMSLGTPAYMSPEQAMGEREIGPRSDVYALGAMTYEMLAGEPPFMGPNSQAIVAKVLTEQPPLLRPKRPLVSSAVENAILTALQKLPADRYGSAKDFADALDGKGGTYAATVALGSTRPTRPTRLTRPVMLAALALIATAAGVAGWFMRGGPRASPVSRFFLSFPPGQAPRGEMLITQDGSRLVYAGPGDSGVQLWVKERANSIATPLAGTNGAQGLGLSPDGSKVAFVQHEQLMSIPLAGGQVFKVADSAFATGAAWLDDGTIVYTSLSFNLMRVKDTGERPTVLWHSKNSNKASVLPRPLPQARGVIFTDCSFNCDPQADLWVYDATSGATRLLVPGAIGGWYLSSGHLAYVKLDGELVAAPFDVAKLEFRGPPVQLMDGIGLQFVVPVLSFSDAGTLVAQVGAARRTDIRGQYEMVWIDRAGTQEPVDTSWKFKLSISNLNQGWALSPDGTQLAIGLNTKSGDDIWIKRLPTGPLSRLTFDSLPEQRPHWTPDGRSVTYIVDGTGGLKERRADGTGSEKALVSPRVEQVNDAAWSHDGKWLVARIGGLSGLRGPRNIYAWRPGVDSGPLPLLANPAYDEAAMSLSPDDRWIAYESDETGKNEVYIRPFPNVDDGKWQVSSNGGQAPLWAHGGKELFYVDGNRSMVAVPVTGGASITLGSAKTLFPLPGNILLAPDEHYTPFDVSPDDRRFIMVREVGGKSRDDVAVLLVENWFADVKSKLGAK